MDQSGVSLQTTYFTMSDTPLFNWLNERTAGVLLHISSLPSDTGIGNLGAGAYRYIDFLCASGISVWQICPLGPTAVSGGAWKSRRWRAARGNEQCLHDHAEEVHHHGRRRQPPRVAQLDDTGIPHVQNLRRTQSKV